VIDIWQADANGDYDFSDQFVLRGRVETDSQGSYQFITVTPGYYGEGGNVRPLHIHLKASYGDARLTTQIYFESDSRATGVDPALLTPFSQTASGWEMVFNIILSTG
jgi:protocatechuate 3,4-dioxygenase beta subunit